MILGGGRASRLGGSKAGRLVGGRSLLERVLAAAGELSDDVLLCPGRRRLDGGRHAPRRVADLPGVEGPAGGLIAGLRAARHEWCLLLACDMPFVQPEVVRELLRHAARGGAGIQAVVLAAPRDDASAPVQPFLALWRRSALPELERRVAAGERSLRGLLGSLCVSACRPRTPGGAVSLIDVDTPEELRAARRRAAAIVR